MNKISQKFGNNNEIHLLYIMLLRGVINIFKNNLNWGKIFYLKYWKDIFSSNLNDWENICVGTGDWYSMIALNSQKHVMVYKTNNNYNNK